MKINKNIFKSVGRISISILILISLVCAVVKQHNVVVYKIKKESTNSTSSHNINANNSLAAIIPSLSVQFLGVLVNFVSFLETVFLQFLFEINPPEFVNSYITTILNHFISPRAP